MLPPLFSWRGPRRSRIWPQHAATHCIVTTSATCHDLPRPPAAATPFHPAPHDPCALSLFPLAPRVRVAPGPVSGVQRPSRPESCTLRFHIPLCRLDFHSFFIFSYLFSPSHPSPFSSLFLPSTYAYFFPFLPPPLLSPPLFLFHLAILLLSLLPFPFCFCKSSLAFPFPTSFSSVPTVPSRPLHLPFASRPPCCLRGTHYHGITDFRTPSLQARYQLIVRSRGTFASRRVPAERRRPLRDLLLATCPRVLLLAPGCPYDFRFTVSCCQLLSSHDGQRHIDCLDAAFMHLSVVMNGSLLHISGSARASFALI